jgi:RNA polymerase sigma-70 factor, ECF subfamily
MPEKLHSLRHTFAYIRLKMMSGLKKVAMHLTEEMLASAARGDQAAFAEIVHEHQAMVFSLAYHFLNDVSLAEELAQEVFLQLYQSLSKIESPAHLLFWLRKVTSHRCIDWARRQNTRRQLSLEDVPELPAPASTSDPILARKLRQLVAALPEKSRMIVTLRFQEGLQLAEIAEVLEMPINTVKSQLQRSLAKLHEKLIAVEKLPV